MKMYKVTLQVTTDHTYEIEAHTPEEAEGIAEDYFNDGENGEVSEMVVEVMDTYPVEE